MSAALGLVLVVACGLLSLASTRLVRDWANRRRLHDHPNDRSAHVAPTPRLGGAGIMVSFTLASTTAVAFHARASGWVPLVVVGAACAVSLLGLVDDLRPLPAGWRFALQSLAATVVVAACPDLAAALAPFDLLPRPVLAVGGVLWIVWMTNLYNFMDGIDGLAGGQGVWAALGLAVAAAAVGNLLVTWMMLCLAAACLGFLRYNAPPASIFMGDAGSTAIGFTLAALPFTAGARPVPVLSVAVAVSLFFLDATVTLVRRLVRGERLAQAHRTHFYQRPLAFGVRHATITHLAYVGMALVAACAAAYPVVAPAAQGALVAAAVAVFAFGAGAVHRHERRALGTGGASLMR